MTTDPRALARAEYLAAREHTQTRYEAELEAECCPNCGEELGYVVTDGQPATRTDPAWQHGHCQSCGAED